MAGCQGEQDVQGKHPAPMSFGTLRSSGPPLAPALVLLAAGLMASPVRAQMLPTEPLTFGDGRATLGGNLTATIAPEDSGYFNFADYSISLVRMVRIDVAGSVRASDRVTFATMLRFQNTDTPFVNALYARIRPWPARAFAVQVGRIPPTFGGFSRRAYTADNPLIGEPLGYQYLTSLRADALPRSADELLRMRGRGWLSSFSIGDQYAEHGVPLVSATRWDTGVQVHAAGDWIEGLAAATVGTLSNPLVADDNGSKQVIGRVVVHLGPSLTAGVSAARGGFVESSVAASAGAAAGSLTQRALGADVEYSKGYVLIRGEAIWSEWTLPIGGLLPGELPLAARSLSVEARYKLRPGLYVAGRADHLGFSEITGTTGRARWDAPVTRTEFGLGYSLQRNLLAKLAYQYNWRDGGNVREAGLVTAQLLFWL